MGLIDRIKSLLMSKTEEEIKDFEDFLRMKFGFVDFLYATTEGLPIMGTFYNYEELSAKVPELLKALRELKDSGTYYIAANGEVFTLVSVTEEVLLLGRGRKVLTDFEIKELVEKSREELGLD